MIEKVIDYIKEAIKNNPIAEQGKDFIPKVYYMNANDGTDFDWEANDRTCELEVLFEGNEYVYIRVYVHKRGFIQGVVWNTTKNESYKKLEPLVIGASKASIIKNELRTFDNLNMFNFNIYDLKRDKQWGDNQW